MLDFIELLIDFITNPGGFLGSIFAFLAFLCFQGFLSYCQIGDWFSIIVSLLGTALFGFLAYKLLFRRL